MTRTLSVHQYHYSVRKADAVSNQMLFIQESLRNVGIEGEIFSHEIKELSSAIPFSAEKIWNCDLLLLHHSQGDPELDRVLRLEIPKALVYHNITPSHFFKHDPKISNLSKQGRKQLSLIRPHVLHAFADSAYNARELKRLGFTKTELLPLFNLSKYLSSHKKKHPRELKKILFTGRLASHKNQKTLLEVFYYLQPHLGTQSELILVGGGDPIYAQYLKLYAKQLNIAVRFEGSVSSDKLQRIYEDADLFICLSQHEGFCIPIVEAMAAQLPVVSTLNGALKDTLGNAGIHLKTEEPRSIADIVAAMTLCPEEILKVIEGQNKRLEEMSHFQNEEEVQVRVKNLLKKILKEPSLQHHKNRAEKEHASTTTTSSTRSLSPQLA